MGNNQRDETHDVAGARAPNEKTRGLTAVIEGFFASAWFGWGQSDHPPGWLIIALNVLSVAGLLVMAIGAAIAIRARAQPSALRNDATRRRYLIIVGVEFGLLFLIAAVLGLAGLADWIPVAVAAGVGIHFIPLAGVFHDRWMVPIGLAIVAVAVVALIVGLVSDVAPAEIAGPGAGLCLLTGGIVALSRRHRGTVGGVG